MGRIKNEAYLDKNPIILWLRSQDFELGRDALGIEGLFKTYSTCNDLYYVWVTIALPNKKIYVYKEYNCGGCVGKDEIEIPDIALCEIEAFINFLDNALERWIGNK